MAAFAGTGMVKNSVEGSCELLWKKDPWQTNHNSLKDGLAYPNKFTRELLCLDGDGCCHPSSWAGEELKGRDLVVSTPAQMSEQNAQALCHTPLPDFIALLRICAKNKDLYRGTKLHEDILKRGLVEKCLDALVTMYARCGALAKAQELLDMHKSRSIFSWTALIAGYVRKSQCQDALNCFERMQHKGLSPNAVTYACVLKACGSLKAAQTGEQIHDEIARQGLLRNDIVLGNTLVDMYAKWGALGKAEQVLEGMSSRNVVSWSSLIAGYAQQGQGEQALNCFKRMQSEGLSPNAVTFACILKACGTIGAVEEGEQIHDEIVRQGLLGDNIVLGTALVDMYAKCGALAKARQVLEELPSRDVVSWNALITRYAQQCLGEQALNCFEQMQHEGVPPNAVTFSCILKACGTIGANDKGEQIHDSILRQGFLEKNIVVGNALVDMYAKCGALAKARQVLDELPSRDVVSWSALIAGYVQKGQGEQAINCFEQMQQEGLFPDAVTFACILKACGTIGAMDKGEQIHDTIARRGLLGNNIVLGNALVDMYVKCGALAKAEQLLEELPSRDVVSWSALVVGYAQHGQGKKARNCFEQMQHEGFSPDAVMFSCVLNACSHLGLVEDSHTYFVDMSTRYGIKPNLEHYACMVDLYGRAGHFEKAIRMIQEMPFSENSAVWSALLGACQSCADFKVGRWAFEQAVQIDEGDAAAYVLMANIYAAAGMQEDADNIEACADSIIPLTCA